MKSLFNICSAFYDYYNFLTVISTIFFTTDQEHRSWVIKLILLCINSAADTQINGESVNTQFSAVSPDPRQGVHRN